MSITGIEQNLPGIGIVQIGLIAGVFQSANDAVAQPLPVQALHTQALEAQTFPGQPGPDVPVEPGVPDQPLEPGLPTEPDQPPPAPVV